MWGLLIITNRVLGHIRCLYTMIQDSSITSTEAPNPMPFLQITKHFYSNQEYWDCVKAMQDSAQVPCIVHFCESTSTLKIADGKRDGTCTYNDRVSISKIEDLLSKTMCSGYYFIVSDIKPSLVNCRDKLVTVQYPLFAWRTRPNKPGRNMFLDKGVYMKWFTIYQPHASRHFGAGLSQGIQLVLDEVSSVGSFDTMKQQSLNSTLTDAVSQELIGTFEFSLVHLPPSTSDIPILHQLKTKDVYCDGHLCDTPPLEICHSNEWSLQVPV